jgi:hypothetical protein
LPYVLTVHCELELQSASELHDGVHMLVAELNWHSGLRVQPVADSVMTAEHLVKQLRRFASHWQRASSTQLSCDGWATEHCMTQVPVLVTSQMGEAWHVAEVAMSVQAVRHAADLESHRHWGSVEQPTRVVWRSSHDVVQPEPELLNWHRPEPTHEPSVL